MDQRVRDLWANALESKEFTQGVGKLCVGPPGERRYCCLGVLTELYRRETGQGEWLEGTEGCHFQWFHVPSTANLLQDHPDHDVDNFGSLDEAANYLSEEVMAWAGLSHKDPLLGVHPNDVSDDDDAEPNEPDTASSLNDRGLFFPGIAVLVRELPAESKNTEEAT